MASRENDESGDGNSGSELPVLNNFWELTYPEEMELERPTQFYSEETQEEQPAEEELEFSYIEQMAQAQGDDLYVELIAQARRAQQPARRLEIHGEECEICRIDWTRTRKLKMQRISPSYLL